MTTLVFWICIAVCVLPFAAAGYNALTRKRRHDAEQRALAASVALQRRLDARIAAERSLPKTLAALSAGAGARRHG